MYFSKTTLNPAWPHFLGVFSIGLAYVVGVVHLVFFGWADPNHCHALLNEGSWLDSRHKNWQPDGCMLYTYTEHEAASCLKDREIKFIGDSVTRKLFFQVAQALDAELPTVPKNDSQKHANHFLHTRFGTNITFIWDPFLNRSDTSRALADASGRDGGDPPTMLVLGTGLWYLRYAATAGGMAAWEKKMDDIFEGFGAQGLPADEVVVLPIGQVVPRKLTPQRADTMRPADIDAMNSDLYHRIHPPGEESGYLFSKNRSKSSGVPGVSLPLVFNTMLDESLTEDGLHYSDIVVKLQARILLSLHCNNLMPKVFPMNKTCCNAYPTPSFLHTIVLGSVILFGPLLAFYSFRTSSGSLPPIAKWMQPPVVISLAIALIYTADRTNLWQKEHKQFNPVTFGVLTLCSLAVGLFTVERGETDMGFLNRDQTDEWKGWMQVAILIYHYFGASKVSGIYNPIRTLVAAYLFMTGYGHTMFYLRKADFGFLRIAQVLIRLNLFTVLLAYTMNTDYISYYFTPLVSMWYFVVYFTMLIGARFNDRTLFMIAKILLSAVFMTWFMNESWLMQELFDILHRVFAIHWSAREWAFRVNLDIWIVFVGMLAAVISTKIRDYRLYEHPRWPLAGSIAIGLSPLVFVWFFIFELRQESKFTYNTWHPYISFMPVLAYVVLRNATATLRAATSRAFVLVGKCSLEAFIIQYHLWLAGDTKGVLLVLPGTRLRPVNFVITSIMFLYVCDRVGRATVHLTTVISGVQKAALPPPATEPLFDASAEDQEESAQGASVPMTSLRAEDIPKEGDEEEALIPRESHTSSGRPLASPRAPSPGMAFENKWFSQLGIQAVMCLVVLWIVNLLWWYPPGAAW